TLDDIQQTHREISDHIHHTPVLTSRKVNNRIGSRVFLKCENFQRAGAFKFRGACNAINKLSESELTNGVATHSSGNHAQAVALSAQMNDIPAYIVMPENAPQVKVDAVRGYGAKITFCKSSLQAREEVLENIVERTGATFIHAYNNTDIITGQGTAALELLEGHPQLDLILAPVGGGGLLSGTAIAASGISPNAKIIGAEPEVANDAYLSLQTGKLQPVQSTNTIADGLRTSLSKLTFNCIQHHVANIITVYEQEIIEAMRFIWERMNVIIEPSSAVPVAAALYHLQRNYDQIGIIISGGNVGLDHLPWQKEG